MQVFPLASGRCRDPVDRPGHHKQAHHREDENWEQRAHLLGRRHRCYCCCCCSFFSSLSFLAILRYRLEMECELESRSPSKLQAAQIGAATEGESTEKRPCFPLPRLALQRKPGVQAQRARRSRR
jgi:hypothetical protein